MSYGKSYRVLKNTNGWIALLDTNTKLRFKHTCSTSSFEVVNEHHNLIGKWLDRGSKTLWYMDKFEDGYIAMISEKGECDRWTVETINDTIKVRNWKIVDAPIREGTILDYETLNTIDLSSNTYFLECVQTPVDWYTVGATYVLKAGTLVNDDGNKRNSFPYGIQFKVLTIHTHKSESTADTGKDLIGKKFTRGGKCIYTFERFNRCTGTLEIKCGTVNFYAYYTPEKCRELLESGEWKLVEEEKVNNKPKDYGEDLLGTVFSRRSCILYKVIRTGVVHNDKLKVIIKSLNGPNKDYESHHSISNMRANFASGYWSIKDTRDGTELLGKQLHNKENKCVADVTRIVSGKTISYVWVEWQSAFTRPLKEIYEHLDSGKWEILGTKNKTIPQQNLKPKTEIYTTRQEEETMKKLTNEITIEVPMSAYAETSTITSYGKEVRVDDEEELTLLIVRIDKDQEKLKDLNKNAKSKRITGQINKLGEARNKITALLDALPDEGENE